MVVKLFTGKAVLALLDNAFHWFVEDLGNEFKPYVVVLGCGTTSFLPFPPPLRRQTNSRIKAGFLLTFLQRT